MIQWNLKGYVAGSILIQTDRGEGIKEGIWVPHVYECTAPLNFWTVY